MKFRAIDIHTHYRTGDRAVRQEAHVDDAKSLFRAAPEEQDPVAFYRARRMMAVAFDVDSETTTGLRVSNDDIARLVAESDGLFLGLGSVDPWKGQVAIQEVERCRRLGLRGIKLHPITQQFFCNDRRFYPLWETCQALEMPLLIHAGTTAIGSGAPGGRGLRLEYAKPIPAIDNLAADFPHLTIIAAHPGWPWHLELIAVARHKGNVFVDLSGWAPKHFPAEVVQEFNSVSPHKFLFGSDYPMMSPDRWLDEFARLPVKDAVRPRILYGNACEVFGLDSAAFGVCGARREHGAASDRLDKGQHPC